MSKIFVELRSGLGNQLFQFAFGYALAAEFHKELVLCPAYFDPHWKYWLKKMLGKEARTFRLPLILAGGDGVSIATSFQQPLKKDPSILILDELKSDIELIKTACAEDQDVYLKGYWQNPNLFLPYTDQITSLLIPSFPVSEKFKATVNQVNDRLVGIHVRRGDFLTNHAFGACTLEYYLTAIQTIQKLVDNPTFLIFTNNRKWVEENFPTTIEYQIYANRLNNKTDLEEMFLLSKLRSIIISNSTFSWWSSYLNRTPDKQIICPEKWFLYHKLQQNSGKLVLKDWIMLANDLEIVK